MTTIKEIDQDRRSLVQVKIGERTYDAVRVASCHTCTHPARQEIERAIVANHSYRSIAKQYSGVEYVSPSGDRILLPEVSYQSMMNHFNAGHLPMEAAVSRALAESRAEELGRHLDDLGEQFVDGHVFAQTVLAQAQERLALGHLQPDLRDGMAAAKFLHEASIAGENQEGTEAAWRQAMQIYFEAARAIMDSAQWQRFTAALHTNPILQQISERLAAQRTLEGA